MDFKQLESFIMVMERGSFSRAAACLYLTQPTVSAHIASLEKELGVRLFARTTKEVKPTRAGETFVTYARDMLTLRDSAAAALGDFEKAVEGGIMIGASSIPEKYFLPEIMAAFNERYPQVSFQVYAGDSERVIARLAAGELDLALTGTLLQESKCLFRPLTEDRLAVITPKDDVFLRYQEKGFPPDELCRFPFISREKGSGTRRELEEYLRSQNVDPLGLTVVAESSSTESIKMMVAQGLGVAVISRSAAADYAEFGRLEAFDFQPRPLERTLYIARRKNAPLSGAARSFFDFAADYYGGKQR